MDLAALPFCKQLHSSIVQDDKRLAGWVSSHLHVLPSELGANARSKRLRDCLLGGKARSQKRPWIPVFQAVGDLLGTQDAIHKTFAKTRERGPDAFHLDDV